MKKKYKVILGVLAAVLVVGLVASQIMQGTRVDVRELSRQEIYRSFTEEGRMEAVKEYNVQPLYAGKLEVIHVNEGDRVQEGDLLASMDMEELKHQMNQLEAKLYGLDGESQQLQEPPTEGEIKSMELGIQMAQENKERAKTDYERKESLYTNDVISQAEMEAAESALENAALSLEKQQHSLEALLQAHQPTAGSLQVIEAQRLSLQSQIDLLKHQMENHQLKAPFSGVVTSIQAKELDLVNPGTAIMNLFQTETLQVKTQVLTRDVHDLELGMSVELTMEQRDQDVTFNGKIVEIAVQAEKGISPLGLEEDRVSVAIEPEIPEGVILGPGFGIDVTFVTAFRDNQLVVPQTSLFTVDGEDAVFVADNGRATVNKVVTGFETRREVVIEEGLDEGDLIIIDPQTDGLTEESRISVQ